ncbi:peptide maturation system protein (TIGR04066 family) [Paenibacillus anaericanus]|uniref:TIGR04066 family peptide maturation system protein n=1 Tax=Paenibacillus anaericanus TaxID=170367 RepID=A0A3S1DMS2_9BACL|nr:TIGR04066 family peptide maturation system protein [Paenibacillus anaericanus]MDQ0089910.1 peptide maturation system protein (TIGR04066 family) [Paenibacillus anaericanus]RUT43007.1 TIGR04066 family peptide maturation system protein [Paenibacillus anaericanus]
MSKQEKLIIYPYDIQSTPIVRHPVFNHGYDILGLISPNGWGLCGKDAGIADYGGQLGINVSNDFNHLLDGCDTVLFSESHLKLDFDQMIKPKIDKAIEKRKNILCTIFIPDELLNYYIEKCKLSDTYFKYYNNSGRKIISKEIDIEYIHPINTPVAFVIGMGERCQKFEIQLALRERLLKMDYKISQVGSRDYCEMFGFHSIPSFMFAHTIPDYHKVVMFNHFIKDIELKEQPDLILIGIPGGLFPFNDEFTNKFGIMAYEISRAVKPDVSILSILYEDYKVDYFTELSKVIKYRFGIEVDCYNLANVKFDWDISSQNGMMTYNMIDAEVIDSVKSQFGSLSSPIFNIFNHQDTGKAADYLLEKLIEYADIQTI